MLLGMASGGPYRIDRDPEQLLAEISGTLPGLPRGPSLLRVFADRVEQRSRVGGRLIRRTLMISRDTTVVVDQGAIEIRRGGSAVMLAAGDLEAAHEFGRAASAACRAQGRGAPTAFALEYRVRRDLGYLLAALATWSMVGTQLAITALTPWFDRSIAVVGGLGVALGLSFAIRWWLGRDRDLFVESAAGVRRVAYPSAHRFRGLVEHARGESESGTVSTCQLVLDGERSQVEK